MCADLGVKMLLSCRSSLFLSLKCNMSKNKTSCQQRKSHTDVSQSSCSSLCCSHSQETSERSKQQCCLFSHPLDHTFIYSSQNSNPNLNFPSRDMSRYTVFVFAVFLKFSGFQTFYCVPRIGFTDAAGS